MREILVLAVAGAAGTIGRYTLSGWLNRTLGARGFPVGTLAVNVIGCLLLGLLMQLALSSDLLSREWRLALTVGFLGAFTTFSTFGYETVRYIGDGAWTAAAINVATNLVLGFAATAAGITAGRVMFGAS